MNYPGETNTYIPDWGDGGPTVPAPKSHTIEEVRARGKVVSTSKCGTRGTVEMIEGRVVSYCACTLDENGKILDFVPFPTRIVKFTSRKRHAPDHQGQ